MIYIVNSIRISIEPDCEASKSFEAVEVRPKLKWRAGP